MQKIGRELAAFDGKTRVVMYREQRAVRSETRLLPQDSPVGHEVYFG